MNNKININDVMEKIINNFDDFKKGNAYFLTSAEKGIIIKSMLQLTNLQKLVQDTNKKVNKMLDFEEPQKSEDITEIIEALGKIELQKKEYQNCGIFPKDELIYKLKKLDQDYYEKHDKIDILNKLIDILKKD